MAAQVTILDITRRYNIKVTPGTYLTEVRDQACSKSGKKHQNFDLKNNGKTIDLSQTWRQCGLSPGVKLELVESSRSPSSVTIALHLPPSIPGGRLVNQFRSDTTLWQVLRWFEDHKKINITQRGNATIQDGTSGAGQIKYEMPRLLITARELSTFGDLQKILSQLGFNSGSVLVRLEFRQTEQPLEEAMVEIAEYFKEQEASPALDTLAPIAHQTAHVVSAPTSSPPRSQDIGSPTNSTVEEGERPQSPSSTQPPTINDTLQDGVRGGTRLGPHGRPISVIAPTSSNIPQAALLPHNDSDYTPSLQHIKLHESRLGASTANQRLLSDAEEQRFEEEKAARVAKITEAKVKISFPDEMKLITTFTSDDSAADLYNTVRGMIVAEDQPFKLVYLDRGIQTVPNDAKKKLIKHLGFGGAIMVNFHWTDSPDVSKRRSPVLKSQWAGMAMQHVVPQVPYTEGEDVPTDVDKAKGKSKGSGSGTADALKGKMAKWTKGLSRK